jgi:hypothetical protein
MDANEWVLNVKLLYRRTAMNFRPYSMTYKWYSKEGAWAINYNRATDPSARIPDFQVCTTCLEIRNVDPSSHPSEKECRSAIQVVVRIITSTG